MAWKKISAGIEMFAEPCLGTVKVVEGKRFMALCVQPGSKKPYRGLARQVIDREGSADVSGFLDTSKLIIVESNDLLNWSVLGDLQIEGIEEIIESVEDDTLRFLGLEDPDIVVDEKGRLQVYFTVPFNIIGTEKNRVYLGHAYGKKLEKLRATSPVLGPVGTEIEGFKEFTESPEAEEHHFHLTEAMTEEEGNEFSGIAAIHTHSWSKNWTYEKMALHPWLSGKSWCAGYVSPCRMLNPKMVNVGKNLRVLLLNGRESDIRKNGKRVYRKFRPGLALYDPSAGEIPWVDSKPLFEDPEASTITFASDVVAWDAEHCLIYAHVNDSFVRAYRVNYEVIRKRLPKKLLA